MLTGDRRLDGRSTWSERARVLWWRVWGIHARALLIRRALALGLAILAGVLAFPAHGGPRADRVVLVAARDLPPGRALAPTDVAVRAMPAELVPDGALRAVNASTGRVLAAAARRGEPLTNTRFVGAELTRITTGDAEHAAVPIRLTEPDIADLLHPGRRVDIVTATTRSGDISVLAEHVPVLAVHTPDGKHEQGRLVVVGLPKDQARAVAAVSIAQSLTVTLR